MKKLYSIIEKNDSRIGKMIDSFLVIFIILNVILVILDSYGEIRSKYSLPISIFENVSVFIFSVEYILRVIVSPYKYKEDYNPVYIIRYILSPLALIDFLAILPFYLPLIIKFDFRIFRMLRVFRLLRVLKIKRYSKALDLITLVFKKKQAELLLSSFILLVMIFFAGSLMYYAENEVQPNNFPNIIESVRWSIKTMIFLGYADSKPLTSFGSILGMIIVVLGLGWLTLPVSILSSGFIEEVQSKDAKCPHCGKRI